MFNTEKYFYTQLFCSKTSSCICDKVCGSQSYNIVWGRHQTLPPSPSLLIIIVIYLIFFQSGTSWLQRSFLKFQMYRKILFSETVRKKGTSQRGKWADGGHMESQQEVKARWFPHVVLATVKISLPSTYTPNRCCFCVSVSSLYLTCCFLTSETFFKIQNSVGVGAWTILFFSIKWAEVEYISFFFPPPPDFCLSLSSNPLKLHWRLSTVKDLVEISV